MANPIRPSWRGRLTNHNGGEESEWARQAGRCEMMAARRNLHWMVVAHHRPLHQRAVKTIREGIARGQFRAVDPDQMVFTIFGMIMYYFSTG